jgi:hypothetical protein
MIYPILMADIISSHSLEPNELIHDFRGLVTYVNSEWADQILSPLTITLGDEFQGIIKSARFAIELIFQIEEKIIREQLSFKLRYVICLGKIETPINTNIAYEMLGSGLTRARLELNNLKKNKKRFFFIEELNEQHYQPINELFRLFQHFIDSWKPDDFELVNQFLLGKNYQQVAVELNMNPSSTWRRQKNLNIEEYTICKKLLLHYK